MLKLQKQRVHNINFVTPTHYLPQILAALWLAIPLGFCLPIVWNSSGYEKIDALQFLDGVVSIYLPDMKYSDDVPALESSSAPGYCRINRVAVTEMLRQVGHLQVDDNGIAVKGEGFFEFFESQNIQCLYANNSCATTASHWRIAENAQG